jgi:hypothetical protein
VTNVAAARWFFELWKDFTLIDQHQDNDVLSTWTDGLNIALAPLGIGLSGQDATEIFPALVHGRVLEKILAATEPDIVEIARAANLVMDTDTIEARHIAEAVSYTKRNWTNG